jgi:hypothetical protein
VHRFFRERAEAWLTMSERQALVDELADMIRTFVDVDNELEVLMFGIAAPLGLTREVVQAEFERAQRIRESLHQSRSET